MNINGLQSFCTLCDLGMAYRKAKVDLFYSSRACKQELLEFELNLEGNLRRILKRLQKGRLPVFSDHAWTLVPKKISGNDQPTGLIHSDPRAVWQRIKEEAEAEREPVEAEFRLMEKLPVDFHVIAALWIIKIGHKLDAKLSNAARGNRLRRTKCTQGQMGNLNPLSMGSTAPYLRAYRNWRDDAFKEMDRALTAGKSIVTLTADVTSFYHKLDVRFLQSKVFLNRIGVNLSDQETLFHKRFVNALHRWAVSTPIGRGLPVGLVASSVIANVALFELDRLIETQVVPLYYGRYVDDVILVMEDNNRFKSGEKVWEWLMVRMNGALDWKRVNGGVIYQQRYLRNSEICFSGEKNKVFLLNGESGLALLETIRQEVQSRASEWRPRPPSPDNASHLESVFLSAIQKDGSSADSLRKADKVSVRRAGFALKLRDIEAYSRALQPENWVECRHAFLDSFIRHILVLPSFFNFYDYLPRLLSLSTHCGDFNHLSRILGALLGILEELRNCSLTIKSVGDNASFSGHHNIFEDNLKKVVCEGVASAYPLKLSNCHNEMWKTLFPSSHPFLDEVKANELQAQHVRYAGHDLAYRPFKQLIMPPSLSGLNRHPIKKALLHCVSVKKAQLILDNRIVKGGQSIVRSVRMVIGSKVPTGLLFPVRPLGIQDLYLLNSSPFSEQGRKQIAVALLSQRGFWAETGLPAEGQEHSSPIGIAFDRKCYDKIKIAVASWKTGRGSLIASACQRADPDKSRLDRFHRIINNVLRSKCSPDYLVFPELSIPPHWFLGVLGKLLGKRISLICGIEYLHLKRNKVYNQAWAALSHDSLGFPTTMVYRQDKQSPARHEEHELHRICGKSLEPQFRWVSTPPVPPIINHGNFYFSILICSELTNIAYRSSLRGKIDALFVPEWNRDVHSFNSIVESAAIDIHAYIIQCNDRQFGDSRIRTPYESSWLRDLVRVKGGIEDYFLVGEIDIGALRAFQSNYRSPGGPFKPTPDGFDLDPSRFSLPAE